MTTVCSFVQPFVRFDDVNLWFFPCSQPIEEKCEFTESKLVQLKSGLKGPAVSLSFFPAISQTDRSDFSDLTQLLEYISNRLLPIFNSSCFYYICFSIDFKQEIYETRVITSLLEMPEIKLSTKVEIRIYMWFEEIQLPIVEISNWLENNVQKKPERFLEVALRARILNAREMLEHLKTV